MKNLLFLCTGNSCRSQMAEGYAKKYLSGISVYSAGIEKHGLNRFMVKVMEEDGIDMSGHYSKLLSELKDINFDIVITVCDDANEKCPLYLKKAIVIHQVFEDPAKFQGSEDEKLNFFRKIRDEIKNYVVNDLKYLLEKDTF